MFAWKKIAMASKQCVTVICLLCGLMSHCKTSFPLSFTRFSEFVPVLNGLLYVCLITLSRVINSATAWPLLLNKIKQIIFSSIVSNFKETNCSPIPPQKRIFCLPWFQIWKGVEKIYIIHVYHVYQKVVLLCYFLVVFLLILAKTSLNAGLVLHFKKVLTSILQLKFLRRRSNSALGNQLYGTHTWFVHTT